MLYGWPIHLVWNDSYEVICAALTKKTFGMKESHGLQQQQMMASSVRKLPGQNRFHGGYRARCPERTKRADLNTAVPMTGSARAGVSVPGTAMLCWPFASGPGDDGRMSGSLCV
jgi:hypothetical protein